MKVKRKKFKVKDRVRQAHRITIKIKKLLSKEKSMRSRDQD